MNTPATGVPADFVKQLFGKGAVIDLGFERFTLISLLGTGGLGVVIKARRQSGETVALKFLYDPAGLYRGPVYDRFKQEIKTTKMVGDISDACVKVYECGEYTLSPTLSIPFFCMEYVPGISLEDLIFIRENPFSLEEIYAMMRQIVDALEDIHSKGIVHRDIKPSNILFDEVGKTMKITDFGISKDLNTASELTIQSAENEEPFILGSLPYLSRFYFETVAVKPAMIRTGSDGLPQHLKNGMRVFRSDDGLYYMLYKGKKLDLSVCASTVLYELITRENPFRNAAVQSIISDLLTGRRLDVKGFVRKNPSGVDPRIARSKRLCSAFERIVKKGLAPTLAETYATAAELRADLDAVMRMGTGRTVRNHEIRLIMNNFFGTTITAEYDAVFGQLENDFRTGQLWNNPKNGARILLLYKLHRTERLMWFMDSLHKQARQIATAAQVSPAMLQFYHSLFTSLDRFGIDSQYRDTAAMLRKINQ